MTFDAARPRYTLTFDGKDYDLLGTLELVEAVETAAHDGIARIAARAPEMGVTDTAKVISAMFRSNGYQKTAREVGETILNRMGVNSEAFQLVKLHVYAFLRIVMEPPEFRERVATDMGELLGKVTSPGDDTKKSA